MTRKSYLLPIVLVSGVLMYALPSPGVDTHAKDKQQITDAYKKMDAALTAKNVDACMAPLAPDYTELDQDGKVQTHNKKEARKAAIFLFAHLTDATNTTTVDDITFAPDGATVAVTEDTTIHFIKDGGPQTVSTHTTERDFWVKHGNTWLKKRTRTITEQPTTDG